MLWGSQEKIPAASSSLNFSPLTLLKGHKWISVTIAEPPKDFEQGGDSESSIFIRKANLTKTYRDGLEKEEPGNLWQVLMGPALGVGGGHGNRKEVASPESGWRKHWENLVADQPRKERETVHPRTALRLWTWKMEIKMPHWRHSKGSKGNRFEATRLDVQTCVRWGTPIAPHLHCWIGNSVTLAMGHLAEWTI